MECAAAFAAPTDMRFIILLCLLGAPLAAATHYFASGGTRTAVIELYTSEGCSSCPPAERWLAGLRDAPGLWRDFVPVAFHVSYWDRLGWRDRFASEAFTSRQYAYASQWRSENVYTPEFVLNGVEWHPGSRPPVASAETAPELTVDYADNGECRVNFAATGDYDVTVAWLGGGIVSPVRAGENAGRTLTHEFVVLQLSVSRLVDGHAVMRVPPAAGSDAARHALVAWVTRRGELAPRQATGGWID